MKKAYSPDGWPIIGMPTAILWSNVGFVDGVTISPDPEIGDRYEGAGHTEIAWENQRQMEAADLYRNYHPDRWQLPHPTEALWYDTLHNVWPDSCLQWAENGDTLALILGYEREELLSLGEKQFGWWRTAAV